MNLEGIHKVLAHLEIRAADEQGGWLMASCPLAAWRPAHKGGFDKSPSFGVHIEEDGVSYYNCFTCKSKGTLTDLAFTLSRLRDEPELMNYGRQIQRDELYGTVTFGEWDDNSRKERETYKVTEFPPERSFFEYPPALANPDAAGYLARRRIPFTAVIAGNLRFDARQRRILFPVYDQRTGKYVGCTGRSILSPGARKRSEAQTGRSNPKVRDYHGLPKDRVLLGERGPEHGTQSIGRLRYDWRTAHASCNRIFAVEGLFAWLRFLAHGYGNDRTHTFAILGSVVTPGKVDVFKSIGLPIYWFLDDDDAGRTGLYGFTKEDGTAVPGALDLLYGEVAQFTVTWPNNKNDPDQLTRNEVNHMVDTAELYVK